MISVCMATYNGAKYIRPQLDSILCQLGDEDELVISDNFSNDGTIEIIKSYNDKRIKLFEFEPNRKLLKTRHGMEKNITNNFENSLKKCKGDYVFFADQDDVWKKDKIEKMKVKLRDYDLVMSNATTNDGDDNILLERLYPISPIRKGIFSFRARGCLLGVTRKLIDIFLPVPKLIVSHDLWAGIIAEFCKSYYFLDEPLILHRRNIGNASTDVSQKSQNSLFYKIYYRINLLIHGFIRVKTRGGK